jgi:hypothetical protein
MGNYLLSVGLATIWLMMENNFVNAQQMPGDRIIQLNSVS